ncbi:type VI secretion system tip protein VgrG [Thalassotalea euphylliae]|uniref:Type VI secretion system tip protein VgrG n=1 Tax=Thalassotalea euphylliae TaxID=1655234 RepID=A0A3E0TTF0_9GAMM|nr:type VI secretion system tip protein VgrG [Thalassotalea euphylliae]REL27694.1 type VI secretion system tip protein VgrG [Thalassotalea euphylliae]
MLKQGQRLVAISTALGDDELVFYRAKIQESLGRPFTFTVEMISENDSISLDDMLGTNATIRLETENDPRYFNGIISDFYQESAQATRYIAVMRPWFWLLNLSSNCRIFQNKNYPDIIKHIFDELGFSDYEDKLTGSYDVNEYVVQFNETDFNFISRIMEQEGIYYYFAHTDGQHVLTLVDDNAILPTAGELTYREATSKNVQFQMEVIRSWKNTRQLRSGGIRLKAFDFATPTKNLEAITSDPKTDTMSPFEHYHYPGNYNEPASGQDYTRILMERENVGYEVKSALSNVRTLFAGHQFSLIDHPREDQNSDYIVTRFDCTLNSDDYAAQEHHNEQPLFTSSFRAVPTNVPFRTQMLARKPKMTGPQTALVVGPSGEEIHTDEFGRIKVIFHWDRESQADENSSCWIRVAQTWAGKGWGSQYIPRIGQEVLVDFLDGDPDKPIVVGSVYNGGTMPPYELPANATFSGVKSNTSKGGGGFNELRFEDKKGEEQIFVHGEKNQDINIKNDCFEMIGHNRHLIVKNDQLERVDNNRNEEVKADHIEKIGKDRHLKVAGKEAKKITGSLSLTVVGDVAQVFKKNHSQEITDDSYIKATNICIEATDNITIKVGGSFIAIDSNGIKIGTKGDIALDADGNTNIDAGMNINVKAGINAKVEASAMGEFKSGAILTLKGSLVKIN